AIDTAAALAMPGVKAVLTAADMPHPIPIIPFRRPNPTIAPYAQPVIAETFVRYVGEPVAVIVAERAELAEDALAAVSLEIEHLPAVADWQASIKGDVLLFDGTASNRAALVTANKGDVATA